MSLRGYKKKYGKAPWVDMLGVNVVAAPKGAFPKGVIGAILPPSGSVMSFEELAKKSVIIKGELPKRRYLRPESKKRAQERRNYNREAPLFLIANPLCMRCGRLAQCVHHWAGRRSNYLKKETWRSSCNECNMFAKNDPKKAREENWIAPIGVYLT